MKIKQNETKLNCELDIEDYGPVSFGDIKVYLSGPGSFGDIKVYLSGPVSFGDIKVYRRGPSALGKFFLL